MNKIKVRIKNITKSSLCAFIKLESLESNAVFSSILLDFDGRFTLGSECNAIFKENEVFIADKNYHKISARNRFISPITAIECDDIFARIFLAFEGQTITSLITREAALELDLKIGEEVLWFVKSNEVMIES